MNFNWFHATQVEESDNHALFFECKRRHFSNKNTTATRPRHKHSTGSTVLPLSLGQPKEQPRLQQLSCFYLLPFPRKKLGYLRTWTPHVYEGTLMLKTSAPQPSTGLHHFIYNQEFTNLCRHHSKSLETSRNLLFSCEISVHLFLIRTEHLWFYQYSDARTDQIVSTVADTLPMHQRLPQSLSSCNSQKVPTLQLILQLPSLPTELSLC